MHESGVGRRRSPHFRVDVGECRSRRRKCERSEPGRTPLREADGTRAFDFHFFEIKIKTIDHGFSDRAAVVKN